MDHKIGESPGVVTTDDPALKPRGRKSNTRATPAITYTELVDLHLAGVKSDSARIARLRFGMWLHDIKKELSDQVGNEFHAEFDRYFAAFRRELERKYDNVQTARNVATVVKRLHETYIAWLANQVLPADFQAALRMAVAKSGKTLKQVVREYRVKYGKTLSQLSKWLGGQASPNYSRNRGRSRQTLLNLEVMLDLEPETLVSRAMANAPVVLLQPSKDPIPFREHHGMMVNDKQFQYMLRPLPAHLESVFLRLIAWRSQERHYIKGTGYIALEKKKRWNTDNTVQMYRHAFEAFFGFLCLPTTVDFPEDLTTQLGDTEDARGHRYTAMCTGLGMKPEDLRFTMLVDHTLVERYVQFRKNRNLLEGTTLSVVDQVIRHNSLLANKDIAFLRRHPEFAMELNPPVPPAEWQAWCKEQHRAMRDLINALNKGKLKVRTREPDDPVKHLFAQKDPFKVLMDVVRRMLDTLPPPSCPLMRALQYRNATVLLLMAAEPLRAGHWPAMRIGRQIKFNEDLGLWVLDIKAKEFKNAMWGYAQDRYRILPRDVSDVVENYIKYYRPLLFKANETDLFLLKSKTGNSATVNPEPMMTGQGFYNMVAGILLKYLGRAVGPHVVRHILVTDHLRKNPGDFETAGALLNDSPETVRANYSHVKQSDLLQNHDEAVAKQFKGLDSNKHSLPKEKSTAPRFSAKGKRMGRPPKNAAGPELKG